MKYDNYQYKIVFKLNEKFDLDYVRKVRAKYPNSSILVEVQNTKGISSSMLRQLDSDIAIRVAGGYDEDRVKRMKNVQFTNGETGQYFLDAVIYTRNETIKIVEEIEKIEAGINENWSDIQKVVYVYDRLKSSIMYDPKFEQKLSEEIRSLRGLISKQTVCAGYAMIFKEIMDRIGIDCEYVSGYTRSNGNGSHAWNIITIDGKKYPIDLTWDNSKYRAGESNTYDWLGKDVEEFSKKHFPHKEEKTQDYTHTLSNIDPKLIKSIHSQINRSKDYTATTYSGVRKDGSRFIIAQIGDAKKNDKRYYRYYYADLLPDGRKSKPLILYSETNVAHLINCKKFNKPIPPNYEDAVSDILFSRENISDSLSKKTYFIGSVRKKNDSNKLELVSSYKEIQKEEEMKNLFVYPTRIYTRSDETVFIAQQMWKSPHKVKDIDVMQYDILEIINDNGKNCLKRNSIFTERNFFNDSRKGVVDDFLSRDNLDRHAVTTGGYMGFYDANGINKYNSDLISYFETSKKIEINSDIHKSNIDDLFISIPSFAELKLLASKYEIHIDSLDSFDSDVSKFKIRDIETGQIQTNKDIIDKAMFANIWLSAAGVKYSQDEARAGEKYAFNAQAEELYNLICSELSKNSKNKGVIDTIDLFKHIENKNDYKYNREIIVNLFRSPYQTELINKLFLNSLGLEPEKTPEPLYSISYAGSIAYNSNNSSTR